MHLDAEIVVLGVLLRDRGGRFAHAEPDFEDLGRGAAEQPAEVERLGGEGLRRMTGRSSAWARRWAFEMRPWRNT